MTKKDPILKNNFYKQLASRLPLVLISLCLTTVLVELLARWLPPPYSGLDNIYSQIFTCHPTLGWQGIPHYQNDIYINDQRNAITLNRLGMHDADHPLDKPADSFRILMLGDSFVHATQVDESQTAHQVLEDLLNQGASDTRFALLSHGMVGWGTQQQLAHYRQYGQQFQPDLVLLMLYLGNDVADNLPGHDVTSHDGFNCYAPTFLMCDGQFIEQPLPYAPGISEQINGCTPSGRAIARFMGHLYQQSHLYQRLEPLIISYAPPKQLGEGYPSPLVALYLADDNPLKAQAWQLTERLISQMKAEVEANGSQFAVVAFSAEVVMRLQRLSEAEQAAFLSSNPAFATIQPELPHARLRRFFATQNTPFLDLTPHLLHHQQSHAEPLYIFGDAHWTVAGNRVVAQFIADWLHENRLVD